MRIALAQMNSVMGDVDGNVQKMLTWAERARDKSCQLIVFPEMTVLGYSPNDFLERPEILKSHQKAIDLFLKKKPPEIVAIFGGLAATPKTMSKPYWNAGYVSSQKKFLAKKQRLPQYDVFDEGRFFAAGTSKNNIVTIHKKKVLILMCEDMWAWENAPHENPLLDIKKSAVDMVISLNASPFSLGKEKRRHQVALKTARYFSAPVIYVNMVGGQDELIFDGQSFVMDEKGTLLARSAFCEEDLNVVDLSRSTGGQRTSQLLEVEKVRAALVLGLRDFVFKNGFSKLHVGLSGGIDSAVVAALACDAVGPRNVTTIAMPGPFSHPQSEKLARQLAGNLGCHYHVADIRSAYESMITSFEKTFGALNFGVVHENIQARIRGNILMMFSNATESLLLATGNKSEYATGYSTLYGDMCGGLAPIGDLVKKQVYALAEHYNRERELIPREIISRAPSAELRPNQKDQDSLPEYDILDKAVINIVTEQKMAKSSVEKWLLKKIANSEFKRWQSPPILRMSQHSFGRGRRFPISNRFYKK